MIRLAPHYIEEPPYEEPPFGWCPECNGPLVDAHECRCGWNEYEAIDGAASQCAAEADTKAPGKLQSGAPAGVKASANGRNRSSQPLFVRSHVARCRGDEMSKPNFKPWRFVGQGILIDDDENEIVLGNVYSDDQIGWLIAAVPEMYEALRDALTWEAQTRERLRLPQIDSPEWAQKARSALAKAEGR